MTEFETAATSANLVLQLNVNDSTGVATAVLSQGNEPEELNRERVMQLLAKAQADHWLTYDGAIDDLLKKYQKHQPCQIIIAEKKDALLDIKVAENGMSATVFVLPAKGGLKVTEERLNALLEEKKIIKDRVLPQAFSQVINNNQELSLTIARGKPPQAGEDSCFIPLIELPEQADTPQEDEDGIVDFRAGHYYMTVSEGTPLLERKPPTPGKVGIDIHGQILSAQPGQNIGFAKAMEGTTLDADDPNRVIAARGGHPVFIEHGVRVDDTLTFDQIDLASGHVEFDGSVLVKGDIHPDMKVEVSGDLVVKGVIERAQVQVGNNLIVTGGILGDAQTDTQDTDNEVAQQKYECTVSAGGRIEARYANIAQLAATGNIYLREYAFNCDLHSQASIYLGQKGGKGNLVGGRCIARHEIIARILGNQAYQKTVAQVGVDQDDFKRSQKLLFLRQQRLNHARHLRKLLTDFKTAGQIEQLGKLEIDKAKKVFASLLQLQQQIQEIDETLQQFEFASANGGGEPNISASSQCFPNCQLTINGAVLLIKKEHRALTLVKRGHRVTTKK